MPLTEVELKEGSGWEKKIRSLVWNVLPSLTFRYKQRCWAGSRTDGGVQERFWLEYRFVSISVGG